MWKSKSILGVIALTALFALAVLSSERSDAAAPEPTPISVKLNGVIRDGLPYGTVQAQVYGHPDFEYSGSSTHKSGLLNNILPLNKKPVRSQMNNDIFDFNNWYNDNPTYNRTKTYPIEMTRTQNGYIYGSSAYYPIDNIMLGNHGSHNSNFTLELHGEFVYKQGQTITFTSDDDLWVYINNKLALDFGGVHGAMNGTITLNTTQADSLGLVIDEAYDIDIYFAERGGSGSALRIDSNFPLLYPYDTTIADHPSEMSLSSTATFQFGADKPGATFECSFDGATFISCASPATYSNLSDGAHSFKVRAVDGAGNAEESPASYGWTIDTVVPDTVILNPNLHSTVTNAVYESFAFDSNELGVRYECSFDGSAFASCTSPESYDNLSDGTHTFEVRAVDGAGNADLTPATYTWTVDTVASDTTILSHPASVTNTVYADFEFESAEAGSTYECSLDGLAFLPCISPKVYTDLLDGSHTFTVRAIDRAGNADLTPSAYTWTIDTVAPETTINSKPAATTNVNAATFVFDSPDPGARFECSLDGAAYLTCSSPATYSGLPVGAHTFAVRAIDQAGNADTTPANYSWTIQSVAPGPSGPSSPSVSTPSEQAGSLAIDITLDGSKQSLVIDRNDVIAGTVKLGGNQSSLQAELKPSFIARLLAINPNVVITFHARNGFITLPLSDFTPERMAQKYSIDGKTASVSIKVGQPSTQDSSAMAQAISSDTKRSVIAPTQLSVSLFEPSGKALVIPFSSLSRSASRSLLYGNEKVPDSAAVVWWDSVNKKLRFAPASYETVNGKTVVLLNHSLDANLYAVVDHPVTFKDMETHWAKESTHKLAEMFIVNGRESGVFDPDSAITRAEFVSLLVRSMGLTEISGEGTFSDAKKGWYVPALLAASRLGVVQGYQDGTFRPEATITREEMTVLILRALDALHITLEAIPKNVQFADQTDISSWAQEAMKKAIGTGLLSGDDRNRLNPSSEATRAETVEMLYRLLSQVAYL